MHTWHLHIQGIVQGVGFRPFVYKLALEYGMKGWVNNTVDGVHIEFNSSRGMALVFTRDLIQRAPALSTITEHNLTQADEAEYEGFRIIHSDAAGKANLLLTPDFAMCDDCKKECNSSTDRRSQYPFITCTNCGPRYSIIRKLPYDRHTTTMEPFHMCPVCNKEYSDIEDRRHYSQTNSCIDCPVNLQLFDGGEAATGLGQHEILEHVVRAWRKGKIVAIKGIGGYLLTCDAANEPAMVNLRERKHRPSKPFALMYPSLHLLRGDVFMSTEEENELTCPASPILLLDLKDGHKVMIDHIAPGIKRIGAMLPYTPLFDILLGKFGKPVIATSGNISNSPVIFDDQKALSELSSIADIILANDREIVVPQDDSVVRYSQKYRQRIIIRRSRGIAPTYINAGLDYPRETIFAAGAMLKSTFTFLHNGNCYISQYLGDTDSFDTQESYRLTRSHFFDLFGEEPEIILADKHPQYFSTLESERLASGEKPLHKFQHHKAHFAAVLGEHQLINSGDKILGVIWDGTGYGDDGQIWGGEFFTYSKYQIHRVGQFGYFPSILGDKMAREPRISLLAAGNTSPAIMEFVRDKFSDTEWKIYTQKLRDGADLHTSSVGRLFDAAACLTGLIDKSSYEGEAAMYLEKLAAGQYGDDDKGVGFYSKVLQNIEVSGEINAAQILERMSEDLEAGISAGTCALKFHHTLVEIIAAIMDKTNVGKVAFSGGVFQNSLLVDLIRDRLLNRADLYFHDQLSPNDESISFGQLMCYQISRQGKNAD